MFNTLKERLDTERNDVEDRFADTISNLPSATGYFGAIGDGVADDYQSLQDLFDYSHANKLPVVIPSGKYRVTSTLYVKGGVEVYNFNSIIIADHNGIGLHFTGGANYNDFYGVSTVKRSDQYASNGSTVSTDENMHGVIIQGRTRIEKMFSMGHQGDGFHFKGTTNLNKSNFQLLNSTNNSGRGFYFESTNDDSSVWEINLQAQNNYKQGIYLHDEYSGRNWLGFWYTEQNGRDTESEEVYIGKLRDSNLSIYAESYYNNTEIFLGDNTNNLNVVSFRSNADRNQGTNNSFYRGGSKALQFGSAIGAGVTAGSTISPFHKDNLDALGSRPNRSTDYVYDTGNIANVFRVIGDGRFMNMVLDKTTNEGFQETEEKDRRTFQSFNDFVDYTYKGNGTIDNPQNIEVGDIVHRHRIGGIRSNSPRVGLEINYEITHVSASSVNVDIVISTKNLLNESQLNEKVRIKSSGDVVIKNLKGNGNRQVMVDAQGRLYAE